MQGSWESVPSFGLEYLCPLSEIFAKISLLILVQRASITALSKNRLPGDGGDRWMGVDSWPPHGPTQGSDSMYVNICDHWTAKMVVLHKGTGH